MEQKLQVRSARAVRCDVAKDDSCLCAVSTAHVSLSLTNDGRDCSLTLVSGNLDAQDKQATMCQLTPKSKWRTFLHCCNCPKSEGEAGILSQMATGWTEEACLRMNALAAEGHSHVSTSAQQKRHDNLWRISLNCPRSNTSTTFANVPTVKKSWKNS